MTKKDYKEMDSNAKTIPGRAWMLMLVVAIITAIAIWLVPGKQEPPQLSLPSLPGSSAPAPEATPAPAAARPGETTEALPLPPPPGGIATVTNGGSSARAFIYKLRAGGSEPDANVVFAEAERQQQNGNLEDAYLLYRYAARHGQTQAALALGNQADPAYHTAKASFLPDPEPAQAYKWYNMAATAGNEEAALLLKDLHKRVQQDAASGDEQARRLLLQW